MTNDLFGTLADGRDVFRFVLKNSSGCRAEVLNYGGIIKSLYVLDKNHELTDVVLGFDTLDDYVVDRTYMGALVGRYSNRIANGQFSVEGRSFQLTVNDGPHHLHGGVQGFNKILWDVSSHTHQSLQLTHVSPNGHEGFPGTLTVHVTYTLTEENEFKIDYQAVTDQPTPVNFTQHSYFNLSAATSKTIENHFLQIYSDHYVPNTHESIPLGHYEPVENTPFSLVRLTRIGDVLASDHDQMQLDRGLNHSYVLKRQASEQLIRVATLMSLESGMVMDTFSTEPSVHVYGANYFDGTQYGKSGKRYVKYAGICLETQHLADSPNKPNFPSTLLWPGKEFRSTTIYAFRTDNTLSN